MWQPGIDQAHVADNVEAVLKACPGMADVGYQKWASILRSGSM